MTLKSYILRIAVGVSALILGFSVVSVGKYFQSWFSKVEKPPEITKTIPIKEVFEPSWKYKAEKLTDIKPVIKDTEPEKEVNEFEADGDYYIIGKNPKGFQDFDTLSITTKDYGSASEENNYQPTSIPPTGYIFTKKEFKFAHNKIVGKQISLETETIKGISYKFVGKFVKAEEVKNGEYTDYVVLKGLLTKIKNGQKVAESKVKFAAGGCGC